MGCQELCCNSEEIIFVQWAPLLSTSIRRVQPIISSLCSCRQLIRVFVHWPASARIEKPADICMQQLLFFRTLARDPKQLFHKALRGQWGMREAPKGTPQAVLETLGPICGQEDKFVNCIYVLI